MQGLLCLTFYLEITLNLEKRYNNKNSTRIPDFLLSESHLLLAVCPFALLYVLFAWSLSGSLGVFICLLATINSNWTHNDSYFWEKRHSLVFSSSQSRSKYVTSFSKVIKHACFAVVAGKL